MLEGRDIVHFSPQGARKDSCHKESWQAPELAHGLHDKEGKELVSRGHHATPGTKSKGLDSGYFILFSLLSAYREP